MLKIVKIVVINPTYNEKENIAHLIPVLEEEFKNIKHDMHILVVDDNSPDGTAEIVKDLAKKYENVHLITGEKQGLGAAYIRGMTYAMDKLGADAVMEMDADFSHKPEDAKRLVEQLDAGFDFVIGSRYVPGGTIPKEWGLTRRLNSKFGNIFARYVAGLYHVHDCTAGYRAIKTLILKKIDLAHLHAHGYSFQMNLLYQAVSHGAKVKEVPVDFVDRKLGTSKLGVKDIMEFMLNAWVIRFERSETFLKFAIVGTSGVVVNLFFLKFMYEGLSFDKNLASPLATELAVISNFIFNNYWTFSSRNRYLNDRFPVKLLKFNLVSLVGIGLTSLIFWILSNSFGIYYLVAQSLGIVVVLFWNYFVNLNWTWHVRR
ncbi:MAG: glycosyltransferase family 2 protein [Patescibacteria group bacterium]|nr:glycosyltransferase family 2 protein [Patescibacteria group bacterium]